MSYAEVAQAQKAKRMSAQSPRVAELLASLNLGRL
jgi:hypothetical protein